MRSPHQAGKGAGLLAVEVALEPMADRLVQQYPGPSRTEHHIHFACRRIDRLQIDQRLTQRFVGAGLPGVAVQYVAVVAAPADAVAARFLTPAGIGHHRHIEPHQGADIAPHGAVGPDQFDRLPVARERCRHLADPVVEAAGIGVDLLQQRDLVFEALCAERIVVDIKCAVGAGRRFRRFAAVPRLDRVDRRGGALQRGFGKLRGMGIAGRFTRDGAQAEPLGGVEAGRLEPAVVEHQRFGLAVFQEQLAVVAVAERVGHDPLRPVAVKFRVGEKDAGIVLCHGRLFPWLACGHTLLVPRPPIQGSLRA